jgi:hypothetical protein
VRVLTSLFGIPPSNCNYRASIQTAQTFNKIPALPSLSAIVSCHPGLVKSKFPLLVKKKKKEEIYAKRKGKIA